MFSGNFRVLIFIDLLATALGGSLILMMILSVSKKQSAPPAGVARNYVHYQVYTDDPNAYLRLIVKNGDNNQWKECPIQETADSTGNTFILNEANQSVYAWGPATELDPSTQQVRHNVFNIYSTAEKNGNWVMGVLYYNNKLLNSGSIEPISKPISIHHEYQTLNSKGSTDTLVTLGNYSFVSFTLDSTRQ